MNSVSQPPMEKRFGAVKGVAHGGEFAPGGGRVQGSGTAKVSVKTTIAGRPMEGAQKQFLKSRLLKKAAMDRQRASVLEDQLRQLEAQLRAVQQVKRAASKAAAKKYWNSPAGKKAGAKAAKPQTAAQQAASQKAGKAMAAWVKAHPSAHTRRARFLRGRISALKSQIRTLTTESHLLTTEARKL